MTRPQSPVQITALGIIALPHSQERHARQHHEPARALEKSIEPGRTHPIPPAFSPTEFLRRLRSAETLISFACARLFQSRLPESCPGVSATLTTIALDDSSLRWLETRTWTSGLEGPSFIVQLRMPFGPAMLVTHGAYASLSPGLNSLPPKHPIRLEGNLRARTRVPTHQRLIAY